MEEYRQKRIGRRKDFNPSVAQIDQWQKAVSALRKARRVCPTGLYKFKTFQEADQWMEMMIARSSREYQP